LKRSYDSIAFVYDSIARLVFGNTLIRAQQYLVREILPGSSVLIVGGGTGWILEEITKVHPSDLSITYVDASAKMIALAQKRNTGTNKVTFIPLPIQQAAIDDVYDIVLTPFFFDNFTEESTKKMFLSIDTLMKNNGIWLYSDFHNTNVYWQKKMLKVMYFFFRISCGIEADRLPDVVACFENHGYLVKEKETFMNGFVESIIYKKG